MNEQKIWTGAHQQTVGHLYKRKDLSALLKIYNAIKRFIPWIHVLFGYNFSPWIQLTPSHHQN